MLEIIKEVFFIITSLAGTIAVGVLVWFLTEKVGAERIRKINETLQRIEQEFFLKETWVKEAVRWAEEKFIGEAGSKKYNEVVDYVVKKANEHGIELPKDELDVLIESQLNKLKRELKDTWIGIIQEPATKEPEEPSKIDSMSVPSEPNESVDSEYFSALTELPETPIIRSADVDILKRTIILTPKAVTDSPFKALQEEPQDGSDLNMMNKNND